MESLARSISSNTISVLDSYEARQVLITGVTGFLGKVLLAMMLEKLPNIGCIYLLIRKNEAHSALDRLIQEVLSSPVFQPMRDQHGSQYSQFILNRIKVIEGDITQPNLGISKENADYLYEHLDLLINVAGLVDFFPEIHTAIQTNVHGALHAGDFVSRSKKGTLIHVSTAYVCGAKGGRFDETLEIDTAPNGQAWDPENELAYLSEQLTKCVGNDDKTNRKNRIVFGKTRAMQLGFSNTYCYTKSLAERLLAIRYPQNKRIIVRPSIVEGALSFPFPGWNEGLNTCAPICYIAGGWYHYLIQKQGQILDVIPVDVISNSVLLIGAAALKNLAKPIYQLASSHSHPLKLQTVNEQVRLWYRHYYKKEGKNWLEKHVRAFKNIKPISPSHPLAPKQILNVLNKLETYIENLEKPFPSLAKIKNKLKNLNQNFRRIEKIQNLFMPFVYDHTYYFISTAINDIRPTEAIFQSALTSIDWNFYWYHIQMPGMYRWIFPLFFKKTEPNLDVVYLNETEKNVLLTLVNETSYIDH